jgi:protein-S-isoprenylcysteine O-methyltransferase Ste14
MSYVVLGCLGFFFLYIFDFNKVFGWHKGLNICFAVGCGLLAVSTLGILFWSPGEVDSSVTSRLIFSLLAVVSLALLLYSLFFALPFDQTYLQINQANTVIDSGMYALCRHPGVIWFFCFYLYLPGAYRSRKN